VWRHDGRSLNADLRDFVAILRQEYGQPFRYDGKAEE
jgi:hypothetical protein